MMTMRRQRGGDYILEFDKILAFLHAGNSPARPAVSRAIVVKACEENDRDLGPTGPNCFCRLQPIHGRHADVQDRQVGYFLSGQPDRLGTIPGQEDMVTFVFQFASHEFANVLVVIGEEDIRHFPPPACQQETTVFDASNLRAKAPLLSGVNGCLNPAGK
jgi:hypothetical protein